MTTNVQTSIPGIEAQRKPCDMLARNAFSRVPTVEYLGLDFSNLGQVTDLHRNTADISSLREELYSRNKFTIDNVTFTAAEYQGIPRSIKGLQRHAAARSLGRGSLDGIGIDQARSRASRAEKRILEPRLGFLDNLEETYTTRVDTANWLTKEIRGHWMAHTNEVKMRDKILTVDGAIDEILLVVAENSDMKQADVQLLKLAFMERLVSGKLQDKIPHWQDALKLVKRYNLSKRAIVRNKSSAIKKIIR